MEETEKIELIPRVTEFHDFGNGVFVKIPTGAVFAHYGKDENDDRYVYDPNFSMRDCTQWFVRCHSDGLTAWQAVRLA